MYTKKGSKIEWIWNGYKKGENVKKRREQRRNYICETLKWKQKN
jgi:hypothetical protein